ncbi:hypothetical protein OHA42_09885 [Nocardia sp. NBC_01009]|nr:hypothetical protein OHA42_09885 [Nocardia sp. NBC_01009]
MVGNWRSGDAAVRYWAIAGFVCYLVWPSPPPFRVVVKASTEIGAAATDPAKYDPDHSLWARQ